MSTGDVHEKEKEKNRNGKKVFKKRIIKEEKMEIV
jgi:hypothetical protein